MLSYAALYLKIHKFYWNHKAKVYPNTILLTKNQLYSYYPNIAEDDGVKIESLCGLNVVLIDYIESPRLLRL